MDFNILIEMWDCRKLIQCLKEQFVEQMYCIEEEGKIYHKKTQKKLRACWENQTYNPPSITVNLLLWDASEHEWLSCNPAP